MIPLCRPPLAREESPRSMVSRGGTIGRERFRVASQSLMAKPSARQRESADFPRRFTENRPERPVIRDELVTRPGCRVVTYGTA